MYVKHLYIDEHGYVHMCNRTYMHTINSCLRELVFVWWSINLRKSNVNSNHLYSRRMCNGKGCVSCWHYHGSVCQLWSLKYPTIIFNICSVMMWLDYLHDRYSDIIIMGDFQRRRGCFNRTWHSLFSALCMFKISFAIFHLFLLILSSAMHTDKNQSELYPS